MIFILQITIRYAKQTSFLVEKDVFSSCQERRTSKKIQSSHDELNLTPSNPALLCSTTEPQRLYIEQGTLRSLYMTRVPHTARIRGSAMSLASYFIYRIRKLFRFELVKEIERVKVVRRFQPKRLHPR